MKINSLKRQVESTRSVILAVTLATLVCFNGCNVMALEQDAVMLRPLESLTKSLINTITLGKPLDIDFGARDIVKSFAAFTWRTGFPVTMPSTFIPKSQDFYNKIRLRIQNTSVEKFERKTLANLKVDLDDIVDAIVDEVRRSPDGLYTNYLNTKVKDQSIEDACYQVGLQLKAYGVDLTNYRNIAGAVLGVPFMPTVASTVVQVGKLVPSTYQQVNEFAQTPIAQVPGKAFNAVGQISGSALNSLDGLRQNIPIVQNIQNPLNYIGNTPGRLLSSARPSAWLQSPRK